MFNIWNHSAIFGNNRNFAQHSAFVPSFPVSARSRCNARRTAVCSAPAGAPPPKHEGGHGGHRGAAGQADGAVPGGAVQRDVGRRRGGDGADPGRGPRPPQR